jgi:hypothetical protein
MSGTDDKTDKVAEQSAAPGILGCWEQKND